MSALHQLVDQAACDLWRRSALERSPRTPGPTRDPARSGEELAGASRAVRADLSLPLPVGLGMFASGLEACGTPAEVERRVRTTGIRWVAVLALWQYRDRAARPWNLGDRTADYLAAIRSGGAQVWVWGWPVPGQEQEFAAAMAARALAWRAVGSIVDVEAPYYGREAAAALLMDLMLSRAHQAGLPLGVTSFGAPWWHRTLPWHELARGDFGVPQIYDSKGTLGPGYPARAFDAWLSLGFDAMALIPAFPTYGKTLADLEAHLQRIPVTRAAIGWQWRTTRGAEWPLVQRLGGRFFPTEGELA